MCEASQNSYLAQSMREAEKGGDRTLADNSGRTPRKGRRCAAGTRVSLVRLRLAA